MNTQREICHFNHDPEMSTWFFKKLEYLIGVGLYHNQNSVLAERLVSELANYRTHWGIENIVLGISGGIDSAVTAFLFREAGWKVLPVIMSIHQKQVEEQRGLEVCDALGVTYMHRDLTDQFENNLKFMASEHDGLIAMDDQSKIRQGNLRARLRMMTLYDLASQVGGCVASTDNFSELAAGFWTLHGDVGDIAPIQSCIKSWEVPKLGQLLGVPDEVIYAKPTDGLGISESDEDQLGVTYLEFDIGLFTLMREGDISDCTPEDTAKLEVIRDRVRRSGYKRTNPYNIMHPADSLRYRALDLLDSQLQNTEENITL